MNRATCAGGIGDDDFHARTNRGPVRGAALEIESDPASARPPGVLEQHAGRAIALIRSTQHDVHVFVSITIEIGERSAMTLLQLTEAALDGDLLKAATLHASEHSVGDHRSQIRVAGAD